MVLWCLLYYQSLLGIHRSSRASELAKDAAALVEVIKNMESGLGKLRLRPAYTDSLRTFYVGMTVLAGFALLRVWLLRGMI